MLRVSVFGSACLVDGDVERAAEELFFKDGYGMGSISHSTPLYSMLTSRARRDVEIREIVLAKWHEEHNGSDEDAAAAEQLQLTVDETFHLYLRRRVSVAVGGEIFAPPSDEALDPSSLTIEQVQQYGAASHKLFRLLTAGDDAVGRSMIAYCALRELGWTVRGGHQWGADFVVYGGPIPECHSSAGAIVLSPDLRSHGDRDLSFLRLRGALRVLHTSGKDLVLCYTSIPTDLDDYVPGTFVHRCLEWCRRVRVSRYDPRSGAAARPLTVQRKKRRKAQQ